MVVSDTKPHRSLWTGELWAERTHASGGELWAGRTHACGCTSTEEMFCLAKCVHQRSSSKHGELVAAQAAQDGPHASHKHADCPLFCARVRLYTELGAGGLYWTLLGDACPSDKRLSLFTNVCVCVLCYVCLSPEPRTTKGLGLGFRAHGPA